MNKHNKTATTKKRVMDTEKNQVVARGEGGEGGKEISKGD